MLKARKLIQETQSSHLVSSIFKSGISNKTDDFWILDLGPLLITNVNAVSNVSFDLWHYRPNSDHDGTLHNSQIDHNETSITIASDPTDDIVHDKHTEPDEIILRKSSRVSKPSGYLKDFHCNMATTTGNNLQERNQPPQRLWHLAL
ncbi:hypothetical protein P8452_75602 [Trifolium repens]|nr:hypothetical protein P8452_75602 [Trifolium repens]